MTTHFPPATTGAQVQILGLMVGLDADGQAEFVRACDALRTTLAEYLPKPGDQSSAAAARCFALAFVMEDIQCEL